MCTSLRRRSSTGEVSLSTRSHVVCVLNHRKMRVNAKGRKWALEAVMGSKEAAHAYLKGSEAVNASAMLGEGRRDGETLFDLKASVQLRADEWDRTWYRDEAELPRLYQALHA